MCGQWARLLWPWPLVELPCELVRNWEVAVVLEQKFTGSFFSLAWSLSLTLKSHRRGLSVTSGFGRLGSTPLPRGAPGPVSASKGWGSGAQQG